MALSENLVVVRHACSVISRLAVDVATARRLLGHDVRSAIGSLVGSASEDAQLCGLGLLANLAASSDVVSAELLSPTMLKRLQVGLPAPGRVGGLGGGRGGGLCAAGRGLCSTRRCRRALCLAPASLRLLRCCQQHARCAAGR
jgi:hypothetical protein